MIYTKIERLKTCCLRVSKWLRIKIRMDEKWNSLCFLKFKILCQQLKVSKYLIYSRIWKLKTAYFYASVLLDCVSKIADVRLF